MGRHKTWLIPACGFKEAHSLVWASVSSSEKMYLRVPDGAVQRIYCAGAASTDALGLNSDSTSSYLGDLGQITNLSGCLSSPISKMRILKLYWEGQMS